MRAIVLAGGFATRLRPISYVIPKLLFPVAGKPIIYWTLDLLKRFQVDEVVLAVNYLADALRSTVGDQYRGMRIKYSPEELPLGTAGPIKLASKATQLSKTFIAMNGDIISNINLHQMLRCHKSARVAVTDSLHEVQDPTRFGVVEIDSESRIVRFVEKPNRKEAPSRLVNAGIYLIDRSVLKMIPSGRKVSLEREIFPVLARRGKLGGYNLSDYWFDIGSFSDYRKANFALMTRMYGRRVIRQGRSSVAKNSKLTPPCFIGTRSVVGREARLGPNTVIGNNVHVEGRANVSNSIIFDHVEIGERSTISGAILGSNSSIGKGVRIGEGAIISPWVSIRDGIRIGRGAVIHPYKEITRHVRPWAHLM